MPYCLKIKILRIATFGYLKNEKSQNTLCDFISSTVLYETICKDVFAKRKKKKKKKKCGGDEV